MPANSRRAPYGVADARPAHLLRPPAVQRAHDRHGADRLRDQRRRRGRASVSRTARARRGPRGVPHWLDPRRTGVGPSRALAPAHRPCSDRDPAAARSRAGLPADWSGEPAAHPPFYRGLIGFDAHLWGDPDPASTNPLYDFNTTIELFREFVGACYRVLGGAPQLEHGESRWVQDTNDRRFGRLLVHSLAFACDISDEPYLLLPYSTTGGSGVQAFVTVETVFTDGTSTAVGPIVAPP